MWVLGGGILSTFIQLKRESATGAPTRKRKGAIEEGDIMGDRRPREPWIMRHRPVLIEATARRLLSPRNYHKEEVVQHRFVFADVLGCRNDGRGAGAAGAAAAAVAAGGR